ncbi:PTS sugar transporter subunit IIA [Kosakonia sp. S42]|uniref:PTS sugar transporter subunit IIA n=1 Tax=Kosakonia sp. S42 TaxID=2767458 RepID=UPI0019092AE7|nr:PTS sugar transporter subunit IIA [Kosakonia sp. S42]MBK0019484.1 PTS sugar transporter subunit IIA [Kosakonia sp. S42]
MLKRELTFYCQRNFTLLHIRQLKKLEAMFRSRIWFINITLGMQSEVDKVFTLLQVSGRLGDLCQLAIEGNDAELAHMVLMSWVVEHSECLTKKREHVDIARQRLKAYFPELVFSPGSILQRVKPMTKSTCLQHISAYTEAYLSASPEILTQALEERESVSATILRAGIAVPHTVNDCVRRPCLTVLCCHEPVNWGSSLGAVTRIILLAAPPRQRQQLRPFSLLVQSLLNDVIYEALMRTAHNPSLYAILVECVVRRADSARDTVRE